MAKIVIHRGRTVVVPVSLSYDVSNDIITSEIRQGRSQDTPLIATWMVTFKNDGKDGELILTIDDEITSEITASSGYMDLKRITGGEPVNVIDSPIQVSFQDPITQ